MPIRRSSSGEIQWLDVAAAVLVLLWIEIRISKTRRQHCAKIPSVEDPRDHTADCKTELPASVSDFLMETGTLSPTG